MSFSFFFVLGLECIITISKLYSNRTTIHVNGRNIYKNISLATLGPGTPTENGLNIAARSGLSVMHFIF